MVRHCRSVSCRRLARAASGWRADRRGTIAIITVIAIFVLIGSAGMALDLAQLYLTKSANQRTSDQSAIAAAFAYGQSGGSAATASSAATSLAAANGISTGTVTTTIVTSPSGDGNQAARVDITVPVALSLFGQVLTTANGAGAVLTVNVSVTSYAEIQNQVPPCIVALGLLGVTTVAGTSITANSCAVASQGAVSATLGSTITAQAVYAVGAVVPTTCSGAGCVQTSPTANKLYAGSTSPTDPYASTGVFNRLPTVAGLTAPSFPSVGSAPGGLVPPVCVGTLTLPAALTYGTITVAGTCSTINFTGGAGTETDIGGLGIQVTAGSVALKFGPGTYKINGISVSNAATATVTSTGSPVFKIWNGIATSGSAAITFNGTATYDIQGNLLVSGISHNGSGAMNFNNTDASSPSTFYVAGGININNGPASFPNGRYTVISGDLLNGAGIDVHAGSTATFGSGSFNIGSGISVGGGGTLTMGGQLDSNAVFQITGVAILGNAITTYGASTLTIGSFPNLDINGPVVFAGNVTLGSGTYTINGLLDAATSGGSSITGSSVSIIASGPILFGAGYNSINLTAPTAVTSSTLGTIGTIALASSSLLAAGINGGATGTNVTGAVYMPFAQMAIAGAGVLSGGSGCLMMYVNSLTMAGSSSINTTCPSLGSTSTVSSVAIVQ